MTLVRKTLKWLVVILLVGGLAGGAYVYSLWRQQEAILRTKVLAKLDELVPEWDVQIRRVRFDWHQRVRLYDVVLRPRGSTSELLAIPELVLSIDREQFQRDRSVVIERVELESPRVQLIQYADGHWNFQELTPPPRSDATLPDIAFKNGELLMRLEHAGSSASELSIQQVNLALEPSGRRRFRVDGESTMSQVGKVELAGEWDIDAHAWNFSGRMLSVALEDELVDLATATSPKLEAQYARLQQNLERVFHKQGIVPDRPDAPWQYADNSADSPAPIRVTSGSEAAQRGTSRETSAAQPLGLAGQMDVYFRATQLQPTDEPEFKILVDLQQAQLTTPLLPLPLHNVSGKVSFDNSVLRLVNVSAQNGVTRLEVNATVRREGSGTPATIDYAVRNLVLDRRLYDCLPPSWQKLHDLVQPAGHVSVSGSLHYDGAGEWVSEGTQAVLHDCTASHVLFPYPVHSIHGTVQQQGRTRDLVYSLQGRAGQRKATLSGVTRNAGPTGSSEIAIRIDELPIDETLLAACKPEVRRTLQSLNLKGTADVQLDIHRAAGIDQPYEQRLVARVHEGSVECECFPLRLNRLQGQVAYTSRNRQWFFSDLQAQHGDAVVSANGFFTDRQEPGELDLTITARGAHFDKQLELALPGDLQELWDELGIRGRFHVLTNIHWVPGQPPEVRIPALQLFNGSLRIKEFPLPMNDVQAKLSYAGNRVQIEEFSARNDDTMIRGSGFATHEPDQWRLRLEQVTVDDLVPDRVFRLALPESLRSAVEELNPQGNLSLSGMLDFRGTGAPDHLMTAAWDVRLILTGTHVTAGVDLRHVRGEVTAVGTWDGESLWSRGNLDLASAELWEHQLTDIKGPYRLIDEQLVVGSKQALAPDRQTIPDDERVTGRAIGGVLTLDGVALLTDTPSYRIRATIANGRLEEYARLYLPGQRNLRGIVNGWIDVHNRNDAVDGTQPEAVSGRGKLQISPAALYELPVLVRIFKVLSFIPPDNTAFNYALVDFTVDRGAFWFKSIDLVGDAINLRGRGTARFDGKLALDFYSTLGRNRPTIPIFNIIIDEATKGWVAVHVRGTISDPRAEPQIAPVIDETLKRFLSAFDPRPRPPQVVPPRTTDAEREQPR